MPEKQSLQNFLSKNNGGDYSRLVDKQIFITANQVSGEGTIISIIRGDSLLIIETSLGSVIKTPLKSKKLFSPPLNKDDIFPTKYSNLLERAGGQKTYFDDKITVEV